MSRLVCSWVDLAGDQDTESWYLNKHIPSVAESLNTTVRNGERAASEAARDMFKEVVGIDGQYMTIYNLSEKTNAQNIDAQTKAASSKLPKDAKIDMRIYEEYAKMHGEEWSDNPHDIQMFITLLWQPLDTIHHDFLTWLQTEFMPGILASPEALRSSIYKLQHASMAQSTGVETRDTSKMKTYMTIWEFDSEDLPWDVLISLASKPGWRNYVEGGQAQWEISMYLVKRMYPDQEDILASERGKE